MKSYNLQTHRQYSCLTNKTYNIEICSDNDVLRATVVIKMVYGLHNTTLIGITHLSIT